MGIDIHLHVEVKINGRWEHYSNPNIDRNHALFAKMANVSACDCIDALSDGRGLPSKVSPVTLADLNAWGGVTGHGWLGSDEIVELDDWLDGGTRESGPYRLFYMFGERPRDFILGGHSKEHGIEDVRFVFWFDR